MKGISETIRENNNLDTISCKKGKQLFGINQPVEGVFMITKGRVKLLQLFKNKSQAIWIAEKSEVIGITSYFSNDHRYQFSAIAVEDCSLVFVPDHEFHEILNLQPKLNLEIINKLCLRIDFVEQLISSHGFLNTKDRVLEIIKFYLKRNDCRNKVKLPYSFSDLADMAGSSSPYIKKLINEMMKSKLVDINVDNEIYVDSKLFLG